MFLLLMAILFIICLTAKGLSEGHDERENKKRAIRNGDDFYIDRHNHTRHVSNDQMYYYTTDENGYVVEKDHRHRTVRNVTVENEIKRSQEMEPLIEEARAKGEKFVLVDRNEMGRPNYMSIPKIDWQEGYVGYGWNRYGMQRGQLIEGYIYKGVEKPGLYVKRKFFVNSLMWPFVDIPKEQLKGWSYYDNFIIVMMSLQNAKLDPDTILWGCGDLLVDEDDELVFDGSKLFLRKLVSCLNETDEKGRFINRRADVWLNYHKINDYHEYKPMDERRRRENLEFIKRAKHHDELMKRF